MVIFFLCAFVISEALGITLTVRRYRGGFRRMQRSQHYAHVSRASSGIRGATARGVNFGIIVGFFIFALVCICSLPVVA